MDLPTSVNTQCFENIRMCALSFILTVIPTMAIEFNCERVIHGELQLGVLPGSASTDRAQCSVSWKSNGVLIALFSGALLCSSSSDPTYLYHLK